MVLAERTGHVKWLQNGTGGAYRTRKVVAKFIEYFSHRSS
jgi:hypothetical protein